jgi:hypothetical protein
MELCKVENLAEVRVEQIKKIEPESKAANEVCHEPEWVVCCSNSSSHAIKYLVQVIVSMTILAFAIAMIATGHNDAVYWSLVTLIVGVFVPSPTLATGGTPVRG